MVIVRFENDSYDGKNDDYINKLVFFDQESGMIKDFVKKHRILLDSARRVRCFITACKWIYIRYCYKIYSMITIYSN